MAWKCAQSPLAEEVLVAPGNAGTASEPGLRNVAVGAEDIESLVELARSEGVGLTIVGPEAPLVAGIVDRFSAEGLPCFGPSAAAAWPDPRNRSSPPPRPRRHDPLDQG